MHRVIWLRQPLTNQRYPLRSGPARSIERDN